MKSTILKAVKVVSLSLVLSLGASGVVFANGAGVSPTKTALNGAGGSTTWSKKKTRAKRRVAKRTVKRRAKATVQHSTH